MDVGKEPSGATSFCTATHVVVPAPPVTVTVAVTITVTVRISVQAFSVQAFSLFCPYLDNRQ